MQNSIVFIRPSKEVSEAATLAADRFSKFSQTDPVLQKLNVNQTAPLLERGAINVLFCSSQLEQAEINVLAGCLERSKKPPYIISTSDNYEKLSIYSKNDRICKAKDEFSTDFIFVCLRSLLTPKEFRFDGRYLRSILKSVIDVISKNTGLQLTPSAVQEHITEESVESITSIVAFYGDGIYGTVSILTTDLAIRRIANKVLFIKEDDLGMDIGIDLICELSNQIIGVMRTELRDFGWALKSSMQLAHYGNGFKNVDTSPGLCYKLPFQLGNEKFDIILKYIIYEVSIREIEINMDKVHRQSFDVRILESLISMFSNLMSSSFSINIKRTTITTVTSDPLQSSHFFAYHAAGWQGEISVVLEINHESLSILKNKQKTSAPNDTNLLLTNTKILTLIVQKLGEDISREAQKHGYFFEKVYSGNTSSETSTLHMVKNSGQSARINFIFDGGSLSLIFSLRSENASSFFDSWALIGQSPAPKGVGL